MRPKVEALRAGVHRPRPLLALGRVSIRTSSSTPTARTRRFHDATARIVRALAEGRDRWMIPWPYALLAWDGTVVAIGEIARAVSEALSEAGEQAAAVYLFGSRARGDARPDSDVDLGLLRGGPSAPGLDGLPLDLEQALEQRLGLPVQVVLLDAAPPDLVHRVLRDGVLVHESSPSSRITFEVDARNRYFDLEPFRRRYRAWRSTP